MSLTLHSRPTHRHTSSSRRQTAEGNTLRAMISYRSSSRSSSAFLGLLQQRLLHFSAPLRAVAPAARHGTVTACRKDPARTDPSPHGNHSGLWTPPGGPRGNCANTTVDASTRYVSDFEAEAHVHLRERRRRDGSTERAAFLKETEPRPVTSLTARSVLSEKSPQCPARNIRASNRHLPCFSATAPPSKSSVTISGYRTGYGIRTPWKQAHLHTRTLTLTDQTRGPSSREVDQVRSLYAWQGPLSSHFAHTTQDNTRLYCLCFQTVQVSRAGVPYYGTTLTKAYPIVNISFGVHRDHKKASVRRALLSETEVISGNDDSPGMLNGPARSSQPATARFVLPTAPVPR